MLVTTKNRQRRRRRIVDSTQAAPVKVTTGKPRILCVDDDPDIVHAIDVALRNFEVEISSGFSGHEGISQCISVRPDLIITDWLMPDGSGEDLVSAIKRNQSTANVPIIALTCLGGQRLSQRLLSMGVSGCLQKPVNHQQLLSEIGRHIDLNPTPW